MSVLSSKKILYIISDSDIGGAGKMFKFLINATSHYFAQASLIEIYSPDARGGISDNVEVYPLDIKVFGIFSFRIDAIRKIRSIVKKISPDIIITFVSHECMLARISTFGLDTIVCSAEREDPYSFHFPWNIIYKSVYKTSDYSFFQLPLAKTFYFKRDNKRTFVIPNSFDAKDGIFFSGQRNKTIVSAGRFVKDKRFNLLLEAFNTVHKIHPEYRLIIYGDGPEMNSLIKLRSILKLDNYVEFPGYIKDFATTIRKDGIFVLSSQFEGMPNTLIEALSTGIPCVSTDCSPGGPRYLTRDGKNGILIPVDDVKAMADAINYYIEHPDVAKQKGEQGKEILSELTPSVITKKWLDAFETIFDTYKR